MNISTFRTNLKQSFDEALTGAVVEIERGGVIYQLKRTGTIMPNKAKNMITTREAFHVLPEKSDAPRVKEVSINKRPSPKILGIPGVDIASKVVCKGTHHMSREDCGKLGCPWK